MLNASVSDVGGVGDAYTGCGDVSMFGLMVLSSPRVLEMGVYPPRKTPRRDGSRYTRMAAVSTDPMSHARRIQCASTVYCVLLLL